MDANLRTLWLTALRSGNYTQGLNRLKGVDRNAFGETVPVHCCLGVLCEVALDNNIPTGDLVIERDGAAIVVTADLDEGGSSSHIELPPNTFGLSFETLIFLMDANDGRCGRDNASGARYTFAQIADWIEANIPTSAAPTPAPDATTT